MKRIIALALTAAFVFGSVFSAQAVEVKVKGEFKFTWAVVSKANTYGFGWDGQSEDEFYARQRTRIQVDFVVSEVLRGVYYAEIGELQWGRAGASLSADGVNVETKRAYIDFNIPNTELMFRVGIQGLALPSYIAASPIFDDDVAGVTAIWPINDMFGVVAFWARLYDLDSNSGNNSSPDFDEWDMWGLILPIQGDGWEIQPWAALTSVGNDVIERLNTGAETNGLLSPAHAAVFSYGLQNSALYQNIINDQSYYIAWWLGAGLEVDMFDPFVFMLEGAYGSLEADNDIARRRGGYVAAEIDYKLDFATLGLMGWWASGEDGSWSNGSEQMPFVSSIWGPTSFGFDGSSLLSTGAFVSNSVTGKWGLGFLVKDLTFIEDLTHQFRVFYVAGTNDPASRSIAGLLPNTVLGWKGNFALNLPPLTYPANGNFPGPGIPNIELTTEDYMWEVNFDHEYKIYENLAAILELGFYHVEYGNDFYVHDGTVDSWKAALGLQYKF